MVRVLESVRFVWHNRELDLAVNVLKRTLNQPQTADPRCLAKAWRTNLKEEIIMPGENQTSRKSKKVMWMLKPIPRLFTVVGAIMFFAWAAFSTAGSQTKADSQAHPAVKQLVSELYPNCHQEMLSVYEAYGLIPLLNKDLADVDLSAAPVKPQDLEKALQSLNKRLQAILLRPKNMERFNLNDKDYLALIQDRLNTAYREAGVSPPPPIDNERLRSLLIHPNLWAEELPNPLPAVEAALILGSSYQDYLNRQNYFFELMSSKKVPVKLGAEGSFPVYLLGGDRPLHKEIDAVMIPRLTEIKVDLNEQNMMDVMFDQALTSYSGEPPLKRYSTHSPKEARGRPTTAGTMDSVMKMLEQDKKTVLVISAAPFTRYQKLVVERQFLKQGREMSIIAMGSDLTTTMKTHPRLAEDALLAITSDTFAREVYEMMLIAKLKKVTS